MPEPQEPMNAAPPAAAPADWPQNLSAGVCEVCDWSFLYNPQSPPARCPHCFSRALTPLEAVSELPYSAAPELTLPVAVTSASLATSLETFARGIPFYPKDLTAGNLRQRVVQVYLPMWLVDVTALADWSAEAGYNYQVVSHQDRFSDARGGWTSQEVQETRVRWESRLGRLSRRYQNIPVAALEGDTGLPRQAGGFDITAAVPYQPDQVAGAVIRLPSRSQQDSWPDAVLPIYNAAAEEVRQASAADHLRQFRWNAEYSQPNWTYLLLPLLCTYYLDDDNHPQPVIVHGQNGYINGKRKASMARAQGTAMNLVIAAGLIFLVGLLLGAGTLLFPPLGVIAGLIFLLALALALGAVIPILVVWQFNRSRS
jgi:hypothetical protein